jgi:hypothetical protein
LLNALLHQSRRDESDCRPEQSFHARCHGMLQVRVSL